MEFESVTGVGGKKGEQEVKETAGRLRVDGYRKKQRLNGRDILGISTAGAEQYAVVLLIFKVNLYFS